MDPDFDEFLHVPARLSVVALLAPADWVEFGFVRDTVGTSDSALSKQVAALAEAGYVEVRKTRNRTGRHTHLQLTAHGRQALQRHASALERVVAAARACTRPDDATTPDEGSACCVSKQ
ncbi:MULTISPECIES: transcriptional regulator [Streptomyces]|uniref:MarR family transcriptional regulator n=2 Tax=Streptomyces TaxID=1883 RepID=A0A2N8PIN4_STRNR|nr:MULTISPECIES: transcriptional regulator [Streptomyces]PNE40846.1 MarR family transcriptional regulator [Streptomyces noursei]SHM47206.1 DNA-binding transcriptional regulator, MarR family [Streptomyces yunnanensis]